MMKISRTTIDEDGTMRAVIKLGEIEYARQYKSTHMENFEFILGAGEMSIYGSSIDYGTGVVTIVWDGKRPSDQEFIDHARLQYGITQYALSVEEPDNFRGFQNPGIATITPISDEKAACKWTEDEDGNWETGCGGMFTFIDGTPILNDMKFCCYCGGVIEQVDYKEDEDDDAT